MRLTRLQREQKEFRSVQYEKKVLGARILMIASCETLMKSSTGGPECCSWKWTDQGRFLHQMEPRLTIYRRGNRKSDSDSINPGSWLRLFRRKNRIAEEFFQPFIKNTDFCQCTSIDFFDCLFTKCTTSDLLFSRQDMNKDWVKRVLKELNWNCESHSPEIVY